MLILDHFSDLEKIVNENLQNLRDAEEQLDKDIVAIAKEIEKIGNGKIDNSRYPEYMATWSKKTRTGRME